MRLTGASNPPPWTSERFRRSATTLAIVGAATLYCLGIGAFALKQQLLHAASPTSTVLATTVPDTATPAIIAHATETLEPTPTQGPLVFPTARPTMTPMPSNTSAVTQTPPASPSATAEPSATQTPAATLVLRRTSTPTTPAPTQTPTTPAPTATSKPTDKPTDTPVPPTATPAPATPSPAPVKTSTPPKP